MGRCCSTTFYSRVPAVKHRLRPHIEPHPTVALLDWMAAILCCSVPLSKNKLWQAIGAAAELAAAYEGLNDAGKAAHTLEIQVAGTISGLWEASVARV